MAKAVEGVVIVDRLSERDWRAWVSTLKTGDTVLVCYESGGRAIYSEQVRVTPTGKVFLGNAGIHGNRVNWARSSITDVPGGGRRFIAPVRLSKETMPTPKKEKETMPKKDSKTEKAESEARTAEGQLAPFLEKIAPNLMKYMRERGLKPGLSWHGKMGEMGVTLPNASYAFKEEELEAERKR